MTEPPFLANEAAAERFVERIGDPIVRNLVLLGFAHLRMAYGTQIWSSRPEPPLLPPSGLTDALFLVELLEKLFRNRALVQRVLDGQDLGEASGWPI